MQQQLFENPQATSAADSLKVSRKTRNEAKQKHEPKMCKQSKQVLAIIAQSGSAGMTRHEVAEVAFLPLSSVCGRVKPMLDSGALFQKPGVRRDGRAVLFAKGAE